MKSKRALRRKKFNNSGSTLIVVLVAVSFLVIVASIILAVSSANLKMKQMEYAMKRNFYVDEIGLDDIYNGIGRDVSDMVSKAYAETLMKAGNVTAEDKKVYTSQKDAYIAFAGNLKTRLTDKYGTEGDAEKEKAKGVLSSYITRSKADEALEVKSCGGIHIDADPETGADLRKYTIKDVKVRYQKEDNEAVITTDIVIEVPYINFFQNFSQILDYSLIGNQGITFKGSSAQVEGNVYAGIDSADNNAAYMGYLYDTGKIYDGMNFYQAEVTFEDSAYIISKGDFNICESKVTIESDLSQGGKEAGTNLWAENIRTVENGRNYSTVAAQAGETTSLDAVANVYAADDLELNAQNSKVTIKGNYYGYNYNQSGSVAYETWENRNIKDKYRENGASQAAHTTSSSIILNGTNATLDVSDLNTLMVAGVAYVDIKEGNKAYSEMAAKEAGEYRTGESVAMRYNQFLYLAPTSILNGVSNPQKNGSTDVEEVCPKGSQKLAEWFGRGYLNDSPVIPVVYQDNGVSYTYYYLNIADGKQEQYIRDIMTAKDPGESGNAEDRQRFELQREIEKKADNAGIASHITIRQGGDESGIKVYTTGLLTDTQEEEKTLKSNGISVEDMASRSTNMQKHYEQLYVHLNPDSTESVGSKREGDAYPLDDFLDRGKFSGGLHTEGKEVKGVKGAGVWIYRAADKSTKELNLSADRKKGIVLCDGDLRITGNGGSFEGLIIATGKLIVEGNVSISADKGVVQAILEAEQRSVLEAEKEKLADIEKEKEEYVSYYFKNINDILANLDEDKLIDTKKRVTSTDYTDYIYYDNWRRGETEATP